MRPPFDERGRRGGAAPGLQRTRLRASSWNFHFGWNPGFVRLFRRGIPAHENAGRSHALRTPTAASLHARRRAGSTGVTSHNMKCQSPEAHGGRAAAAVRQRPLRPAGIAAGGPGSASSTVVLVVPPPNSRYRRPPAAAPMAAERAAASRPRSSLRGNCVSLTEGPATAMLR